MAWIKHVLAAQLVALASATPVVAQVPSPGGRSGAMMVYDAARRQVLLFGGESKAASGQGVDFPDDLWAWNGESWRRLDPRPGTPRPVGREVPQLVYDAARQRVLMFGGRRRPAGLTDVWQWDGAQWEEIAGAGFDPVMHAATVYDPAHRRVVMFGGGRSAGPLSRTLSEWNGSRWLARDSTGPENTLGLEFAARPTGELILLARGPLQDPRPVSRIWKWNGTTWSQGEEGPEVAELQASTSTPDGTLYFYQSWDRWLTAPVMHRRVPAGVWTEIPMTTHPGMRYTEAAAWDAERGRMVLYGGRTRDGQFLDDTWEFDGRAWVPRRSASITPVEPPRTE